MAGKTHEVIVLEDGVLFRGKRYRSLSEVARRITGSRWSGPSFFGLEQWQALSPTAAAPSTPASPPRRGWSRTSTPCTPSGRPARPTSRARRHEGWRLVQTAYDDGGYLRRHHGAPGPRSACWPTSEAGKVDVVVVYKVDRLTRSLADFAKMVEIFDGHGVSFVSVTQQFNTTTSMGRLTLNVLLSFAQFEREVTGERIRDKIAASKKKGMWMGGNRAARLRRPGPQAGRQRGRGRDGPARSSAAMPRWAASGL